jgi:hypothetical protein
MQLPACYRIQNLGTGAAMIGKKLCSPLRNHLRLVLHILATTGSEKQHCETRSGDEASHRSLISDL